MPTDARALLLDFGGVIAEDAQRPDWASVLAETVHTLLSSRRPSALDAGTIAADLVAGMAAYARWCDAMCRPYAPVELGHEQFWSDFVAADWPAAAREVLLARATTLCHRLGEVTHAWRVRDGMAELLADAANRGMLLAVVSNTLYGSAHRDFLERNRIADRFAVQLYSDEVGVRKPNPELILRATRALGVPVEQVWFAGDTISRDVLCGRRARVGMTILMRSERTGQDIGAGTVQPDRTVADPYELRELLTSASPAGRHRL
ncbi:MAG: HAD family hydrolase [Micromonosporaceae bacterium]|nr:HAD family hydrolase [Micromonosporaceae bacterium]